MHHELDLLRDFNDKVDRLERTRFAKRFENDLPEVFLIFEELEITDIGSGQFNLSGKLKTWKHDFDEDEIDAFVLTYRMLTQKNDRLSLAQIGKIYELQWMPDQATSSFREARAHLNSFLDSAATLEFGSYQIAIREIVDIVLYGGLAHSNRQKATIFRAWISNPAISGFIWVEFQAAMMKALSVFRYVRKLNTAVIEKISGA